MRKVISYFIKYDVAVNVIILAFVVFGIVGASRMTSSFFPLVDSQIININIIHQDPDNDDHPEEGKHVDGHIEEGGENKHPQKGDGQAKSYPKGKSGL